MSTYSKILAAIDFSSHAPVVASEAVTLARKLNATLVFVNVINQRDVEAIHSAIERLEPKFDKISFQRCIDQVHSERETKMEALKKDLDVAGLDLQFITRTGTPFQELLAAIQEEGADLLVMGIKGRSDLADIMIGSTALKMFKRCPVPMLTVRREHVNNQQ